MGKLTRWSPGNLYEEVKCSPEEVFFRYPSRRLGSYLLFATCLCLAGWGFWIRVLRPFELLDLPWMTVTGGFTLLLAGSMIYTLWNQRVLRVRTSTQRLTYLRRTPLKDEQVTLRFTDLKTLHVEPTATRSSEGPPGFDLLLQTDPGSRFHLGTDSLKAATALGRRLSDLLQIPLQTPSP